MAIGNLEKEKITKVLLVEIQKLINAGENIPPSANVYTNVNSVDELYTYWWATGRGRGLRLTYHGMDALELIDVYYYDHKFTQDTSKSTSEFILELQQKIKCPYYLTAIKKPNLKKNEVDTLIRLYDSKIAMTINLYGSLTEYLASMS